TKYQMLLTFERIIKTGGKNLQDLVNLNLSKTASSMKEVMAISLLTADGRVAASSNSALIGTSHSGKEYFVRGKRGNCIDVLSLNSSGKLVNYLSGPLYNQGRFLGVLVIEEIAATILDVTDDYTGLGSTGETFLVKKDKNGDLMFLVPLRFDPHAALRRTVSMHDLTAPSMQALQKEEQILTDAVDYRGKSVLAVIRYIRRAGWGLVVKRDRDEAFASVSELRNMFLIFTFAIAVIMLAVSFYVAGSVTTPLINLTTAARKIKEGDFSVRAEVTSNDEMGDLEMHFNRMTENLVAANASLEQNVKERTAQLEAANKDLDSFSYSVSHDLRSPLRAIDSFSGILMEEYHDRLDDEGRRLLNIVRDNAIRMGQLIDDVLAFSRMSRKDMQMVEINIGELVNKVIEDLKPSFEGRSVRFEIKLLPPVYGDRSMMRQVFVNLLSNAIKFTHLRAAAIIEIGVEGSVYYIKDNGVGFDMQYVDKLFGLFQRLHRMDEYEGTGIGLAIVKRIITKHGGRVWAEGKPDEGATFYFTLAA